LEIVFIERAWKRGVHRHDSPRADTARHASVSGLVEDSDLR